MRKTTQFKEVVRNIVHEPMYLLDGEWKFERLALAWTGGRWYGAPISFMELSKGFLRSTAESFVRDEVRSKFGAAVEVSSLATTINGVFDNEQKLDESILNALCWWRFATRFETREGEISLDFWKLLRFAFGDYISAELKSVFTCLRHSQKSEILKQIQIDAFQTGAALRSIFEKDAKSVSGGGRNSDKLSKFLERTEGFGAFAYEKYKGGATI